MTAISVIIPVYNVEPYIVTCIDSLKQQRFRDLEFIFIDDCSTDDSMVYVEEFARTDARVRILRCKENSGSGSARNLGIEVAKGEYLSFVDPDDRIAPDFYEKLYEKAVTGNYDIVKGTFVKVYPVSGVLYTRKMNGYLRKRLHRHTPLFVLFSSQHQTAIYKKNLFDDKIVRYGKSRNAQDTTFLLIVCKKTQNIGFQDSAIYYYSVRPGSQVHTYDEQRSWNELESLREKIDFLLGENREYYDFQYLNNIFQLYIGNICYSISEGLICKERGDDFVKFLREQLLRIPEWTQVISLSTELLILMDYQQLISTHSVRKEIFHFDRIQRWTDFLTDHPDLEEKEILAGYNYALLSVFFLFIKYNQKKILQCRSYFVFVRKQLTRLSGKRRKLLLRCCLLTLKKITARLFR